MHTSPYFLSHPLIGILSVAVMVMGAGLVLFVPRLSRLFSRRYPLYPILFYVLSRIGLFLVISVGLGHAAGCDKAHWLRHVESATSGLLPYVDYTSEYGPLFSYLLAPAFLILGGHAGPLVVFMVFDFLTFMTLHKIGGGPGIARRAAMLYLVTPISWFNVVRYGQDESVGAFFLVLMLLALKRRRYNLLGIIAGLGTLLTKVLFLLPAVPVLLKGGRRFRSSLIAAVLILAGCMPFALLGGGMLSWVPKDMQPGGPVFWTILMRWFHIESWFSMLIAAGVLLFFTLVILFRGRNLTVTNAVLLLYGAFMLVSPKAWSMYALLVLPVLCVKIARAGGSTWRVWFAAYSFTMVFHHYCYGGLETIPVWNVLCSIELVTVAAATAFHAHLLIDSLRSMSRSGMESMA